MKPSAEEIIQAEALFTSDIQRSDNPGRDDIRSTVRTVLDRFGPGRCAERVAYEFGEHPETAAPRMTWCREAVTAAEPD